jgi:hypothetical protein
MEWRNTVKRCADEAAARKAGGEEMTKAPSRSVEIGPITIATNDTGACFFPATADSSVSVPQEPNNEEMENYRMALAYISKQSSDPQSRELAETALNAFPADRVPQSPADPVWWRWRFFSQSHGWSKWISLNNDEIPAFRKLQGEGLEAGRIELEPLFAVSRPDRDSK